MKTLTNALGEATGRRSGAVSYTYDYDDLYRLTTATGAAKSRPGVNDSFKTTYAFDEIHNMTRLDQKHWLTTANDPENETAHPPQTNHDFDYVYGSAAPHQATKIGDRNLVYDANGNTLRECRDHGDATCQANSDKLRRYFWGEENELNAVIDGGGWNITRFIYDAGGQRVVKLGRGGESITVGQFFALKGRKAATKHIFIGETRIASKLLPSPGWEPSWSEGTTVTSPIVDGTTVEGFNGCNPSTYQPQKCPIDPAANPVLDRRPDTTKIKPATYYYHSDHLGSTSWVTDQNGRVHEHVEYFPYGEVWRDARYDSDGDPVHRQQFLFSAKEMDEETGLYYFGARYLDPVRARWVSTDPIVQNWSEAPEPGKVSLYAYARWKPQRLVDPDGRDPITIQLRNSLEFLERNGVNDHLTYGEMVRKGLLDDAIAPYGGRMSESGPPPEIEDLVQFSVLVWSYYVGAEAGPAVRAGVRPAAARAAAGVGRLENPLVLNARATAPVQKFADYVFRRGATHGKDAVFRELGYAEEHSARLAKMWEEQGAAKFANGEYTLGKLDQYGQRIDIEIEVPGIGSASGKTSHMRSGWMVQPDGSIKLNTPFSGFTR